MQGISDPSKVTGTHVHLVIFFNLKLSALKETLVLFLPVHQGSVLSFVETDAYLYFISLALHSSPIHPNQFLLLALCLRQLSLL